jgi:hypothetical protein
MYPQILNVETFVVRCNMCNIFCVSISARVEELYRNRGAQFLTHPSHHAGPYRACEIGADAPCPTPRQSIDHRMVDEKISVRLEYPHDSTSLFHSLLHSSWLNEHVVRPHLPTPGTSLTMSGCALHTSLILGCLKSGISFPNELHRPLWRWQGRREWRTT